MQAVNLLPRDERRAKTLQEQLPLLVGGGLFGLITVLVAAGYLWTSKGVQDKQSQLDSLQTQLAELPKPPPPRSPVEAGLRSQQSARISAVSSALSRRVGWDRVLRELSLVMPSDVWLTSLAAKSPTSPASAAPAVAAAPGAAPTGVTINGYTYSHAGVARFLSRLLVLPDLRNVQLQNSQLSKVGSQSVVSFTILADVRPPGAQA